MVVDRFKVEPFVFRAAVSNDEDESFETRDNDDPLAALCDVTYEARGFAGRLGKGEAARLLLDCGEEVPVWPNRSSHIMDW